jgi:hypothetical protein
MEQTDEEKDTLTVSDSGSYFRNVLHCLRQGGTPDS